MNDTINDDTSGRTHDVHPQRQNSDTLSHIERLSDSDLNELGEAFADVFQLKKVKQGKISQGNLSHSDYCKLCRQEPQILWETSWGTKTGKGLILSVVRFLDEARANTLETNPKGQGCVK